MAENDGTIVIEDAHIFFLNFSGKEGPFNREGDRNFCVALDPQMAKDLERDHWNIKYTKVREEGDESQPYVNVSVKYTGKDGKKVRPPILFLITSKGRTPLSEEECEFLDWVDIKNVDLIIRPYSWSVSGNTGVKAYLKAIYITVQENRLERKYAHLPEVSANAALTDGKPEEDVWDAEVVDEDALAIEA